ncbi:MULTISPECIES: hypothetical protein [unclassified Pseudoalteromonas]|uniref:hypothetical protein n=1 Tax=unclassified Pseudoalteromonas TaxID=194690 RepID=UPI002016A551|nr:MULTISPECIES: hypothetical protein [unclassified Pseudoalteromonas]
MDGAAGFSVGVLLFALLEWVSVLYNLPVNIVVLLASANVIYGINALNLAFLVAKPVYTITVLAIGNVVWAFICIAIVLYYVQTASLIGIMFIVLEAGFVIILAYYEFKLRFVLANVK